MNAPTSTDFGIQSTAGAVPVRNEKGEIYMKKVKVQRYISGKRPQYAHDSDDADSDLEDFIDNRRKANEKEENQEEEEVRKEVEEVDVDDPRLRRLKQLQIDRNDDQERVERHRAIHEPQFLDSESEKSEVEEEVVTNFSTTRKITLASDSESDGELSDTEIESRRQRLRNQMLQQQKQEEILQKEEENKSESSESESSEYEDETESEEDHELRLKPLFVRKRDRATIAEKEREVAKQKQLELEEKRAAKERRRETLRLVEQSVKRDLEKTKVWEFLGTLILNSNRILFPAGQLGTQHQRCLH